MVRRWTDMDRMMVITGKLTERVDILEFIQKRQDNEIERMRSVMRGELAIPQPQRRRKGRQQRKEERVRQ